MKRYKEVFEPKSCLLKAVWVILDGVGDAIDGTVEEISAFLFERLNKQAEGGEVNIANNTKTNTNKSINKQRRGILVHLFSAFVLPCIPFTPPFPPSF